MADKAAENVTDTTRLEAIREIVTAKRRAAVVAAECSAIVRKWNKAGVHTKAAQIVAKLRDEDPEEVVELIRELVRMLALVQIPVEQAELFPEEGALPSKVIEEQSEWEAEDAGFLAGKAGRPIDDSPYNHQPGSALFVKWRDGWDRGQAAIAYSMGPDAKQATDERRPRGRPRKEKNVEDPAEGTA